MGSFSALAADRKLIERNAGGMKLTPYVVYSGATIYQDSIVALRSDGTLIAATASTSQYIAGIARDCIDGFFPATSGMTVAVATDYEVLLPIESSITAANLKQVCYAENDNAVQAAASGSAGAIGTVEEIYTSTQAWVLIGNNALALGTS